MRRSGRRARARQSLKDGEDINHWGGGGVTIDRKEQKGQGRSRERQSSLTTALPMSRENRVS